MFDLHADYQPAGDQPQAISTLVQGLNDGLSDQILLGVTGSGKTFTMANIIAQLNRPALILAHNKTLAAQLCNEFKEFFPNNAIEYFVSYYDYYQPEAYVPTRDVYIEKEADINEEIERLRHRATRSLFTRDDVIIVASVSCIYGLGIPETYVNAAITFSVGDEINQRTLLMQLNDCHFERNDLELKPGRYRVKGDTVDIFPSSEETLIRLEFFGDELESIHRIHPVSAHVIEMYETYQLFPATHYLIEGSQEEALAAIRAEMLDQVAYFKKKGLLLEANRIESRTLYDMEMIEEMGYCKGIENYSRHLSNRAPGTPGGVLLDFFPDNFVTFIDESHVTVPQVRGMFGGDASRKQNLIDYGFRLPSARDNRPLNFNEFEQKINQTVYVTATPGPYELEKTAKTHAVITPINWDDFHVAQQIIRPTGLVDPEVSIHPTDGQIDHLLDQVNQRIAREERVLVTTLTKQLAEQLTDFLSNQSIKVQYIHSDINAIDRIDILHYLRTGKVDVLVGVNLLREGLDLPEVSLVAILDADKEGFLRNERSLIQTMGRAARHINGHVLLYADKLTDSMRAAMTETNRRRQIQLQHNKDHGITPKSVSKKISDIRSDSRELVKDNSQAIDQVTPDALPALIKKLEKDMNEAAANLEFEVAAVIRDQLEELKNTSGLNPS